MRLLFTSALFVASHAPSWAVAQTTDDPWAVPLNLSHSGVAINPAIVIDSDEGIHAVWQDETADFVYTRLDGDQWRAPRTTDLNRLFQMPEPSESIGRSDAPIYTGPNPLFIAGPGPYIFAFWISPLGKLFTSKVANANFEHYSVWDSGGLIASQAASFAVAIDARGEWHLAYFRTVDDPKYPAGIYYTRSRNSGWNWAVPELLYESPYLRRLEVGEANLSIATDATEESSRVYIAWDNRPRKQVLLAQSADGGQNWEQPTLIEGPAPDAELTGPFNIQVGAKQDSVVLVWHRGQPGGACNQVYQSSRDGGATWSDPQPMLENLLDCVHSNEFVTRLANNSESLLYFLTETQGQLYLSAWNGRRWSELQAQPALSGFEDPEIFTEVIYGCHRASLSEEHLYVIGCDEGGGGDVWVTSRDLGSSASWFSSPVWSPVSPITDENLEMESVELVATRDDLIHAFFSQRQDPAIYYTHWDGEMWSHITPALELPDGEAGWPAIAEGPGNELLLVTANNRGALYFSRTAGGDTTKSLWSTPARVGTGHDGQVGSADVAWDAAGTVYVAYSVPVNDERGIYLVQSNDQGETWSEPLQVFNGAAAGFDLVGAPSLLISDNGLLHIVWKQQSIRGDGVPQPLSLYSTRSEDSGYTFNDAELIVEEPVVWREIVTAGEDHLHLFWQSQDTMTTLWDKVSLDGGRSWQFPQGLPVEGKLATVTRDLAGRLHLVGVGTGTLDHWLWDGSRWQPEAPLAWALPSQRESSVELLAAAVNKQGKMVVVLAVQTSAGDTAERMLLYSTRTLELPAEQTGIQEVPTQTLLPPTLTPSTASTEPSSSPASTLISEPTRSQGQTDGIETNDPITPFTMALVPVAILLLSVLGIMIRRASQAKDR